MTNSTLSRSLIAAAFVSTVFGFASSQANASVTSDLQNCASSSKNKTVSCCQTAVRGGEPLWMRESGRNCQTVVTCSSRSGGKRCYVKYYDLEELQRGGTSRETYNNNRDRDIKAK